MPVKLDAMYVLALAAPVRERHPDETLTVRVPSNRWSAEVAAQLAPAIEFEAADEPDDDGEKVTAYVYPAGSWKFHEEPPLDLGVVRFEEFR